MSAQIHLSPEAQSVLQDALKATADNLELVKEARAEIARLKVALAEKDATIARNDEVMLEKVANAKVPFRFDEKAVRDTVSALVGAGLIKEASATKFASDFINDPTTTLATLKAIADISTTPNPQGFGAPRKNASVTVKDAAMIEAEELAEENAAAARMAHEGA